jgi:hypothetical protein
MPVPNDSRGSSGTYDCQKCWNETRRDIGGRYSMESMKSYGLLRKFCPGHGALAFLDKRIVVDAICRSSSKNPDSVSTGFHPV